MKLPQAIRDFFGIETADMPSPVATRGASILSVDIVNYAISLASNPDNLRAQQAKLAVLARASQDEQSLVELYRQIEAYLVKDDLARAFQEAELRQRIWDRFSLIHVPDGLALLFAPPEIQEIKLGFLVLQAVLRRASRLLGRGQIEQIVAEATAGTVLSGLALSRGQINLTDVSQRLATIADTDIDSLLSVLSVMFTALLQRLNLSEGPQAAQLFEQAYNEVKVEYDKIADNMPKVAALLPEGVLETEKLRYLSRDVLEERVREKTQQLELEKTSVEHKIRDRTRELLEEQAKLASSIESLSQGLIMVDNDDRMIVKNTAAGHVLGYGPGRHWSLDDAARDMGTAANLYASIKKVRSHGRPVTLPEVKFGSRVLRLSLTPVRSKSHIIGVVLLIQDVTEAKVLERSREEFFSIASHELRTPLTAIRGNAAMIQQYFPQALKDANLRGMVIDIHDSSVRLIEIVNDFLDASRLEQGRMKFTFSDFNVGDIVEKVAYELAAVSREKRIYLRLSDELKARHLPLVYADPDRVKQVVYNLVGNAMKFVEQGGVTLAAEVDQTTRHLIIKVTDTGPGISQDAQKLLFHKFQQAGESIITRDTTRGTGLGLYISKLLLEHMGGRVGLEKSTVGQGSTFSFTLPLTKTVAKTKAKPAKPKSVKQGAKV